MTGEKFDMVVKVRGLKELQQGLIAAPREIKRMLPRALKAGAEPALAEAIGRAPSRSGALAQSIRLRTNAKGVAIGSPLAYAPVLEYAHRGRYASLAKWGAPPRFLIPAVTAAAADIEAAVTTAIEALLDEIFGRTP